MNYILCILMGYCIGCINPAYIISKIKGFDIRQRGTGNAGASNAMMTMGKKIGVFIALFDIIKAAISVVLASKLFPQVDLAEVLTGAFCVLGHIFPLPMKFRGGKGLACLAGFIMAYDIKFFAVILVFELVLGLLLDYICVMPITGSVIFTVFYAATAKEPVGTAILAVISIIVFIKHIGNLKRIKNRTEVHISHMWKKNNDNTNNSDNQKKD